MTARVWSFSKKEFVPIEVQAGDEVEWKRQGEMDTRHAVIVGFGMQRVRLALGMRVVSVKPVFAGVWRNGVRLP